MIGLWEHSLGCAMACQHIARRAGFKDPEEYSVAGLLHDLGKVVTACQMQDVKADIDRVVREKDLTYFEAERDLLGFGHDRINAWLADHWKLPPNIKEALAYHHKPHLAPLYPDISAAVHIGDFLVRLYEYGSGGDDNVTYLRPEALNRLKIRPRSLERIMDLINERFLEISDLSFA
jgi:putative nucleotidyltransferase with HDIG domain